MELKTKVEGGVIAAAIILLILDIVAGEILFMKALVPSIVCLY